MARSVRSEFFCRIVTGVGLDDRTPRYLPLQAVSLFGARYFLADYRFDDGLERVRSQDTSPRSPALSD